ncbi:hypothetical protein [Agromyces humatus]|uniref:Lipoprotein n=1 Tax=Agromyces humatus TaxID=279573 RepID=A0ABP4WS18_9MICO|nr:hypothetical protein [Agromyces humatus]
MPHEFAITGRRLRSGAAAVLLVSLFLTGCVPPPNPAPAAPAREVIDGDPDDGLTVTGGGLGDEQPYTELTGGFFADDDDALATSVAVLDAYTDEYHSITRNGDPHGGDLSDILTPAMEDQVRAHFPTTLHGPTPVEIRVEVSDAFVLRRIEDTDGARVHFAYCREDTLLDLTSGSDAVAEDGTPLASVRREFAASVVSNGDDPRRLRIEAIVDWMGEPFC